MAGCSIARLHLLGLLGRDARGDAALGADMPAVIVALVYACR